MINNPKIIEEIKQKLKKTTKEQLKKAIELVDNEYEEYNEYIQSVDIQNNNVYIAGEEYKIFSVHKRKTRRKLFNIFSKNDIKKENLELEAA